MTGFNFYQKLDTYVHLSSKTFVRSAYLWSKTKVLLENGWNSKQMITEGQAAIPLSTTLHAFRNQEKTKQRSTTPISKIYLNTLHK